MIRKNGKRLLTGILCVSLFLSKTAFADIRTFAAETGVSVMSENAPEREVENPETEPGEGAEDPETEPGEGVEDPETEPGEGVEDPETEPGEGAENPETEPGESAENPEMKPGERGELPDGEGAESDPADGEEAAPDDGVFTETPEETVNAQYSVEELLAMDVKDRLAAMSSPDDIESGVYRDVAWVVDKDRNWTQIGTGDFERHTFKSEPRTATVIIRGLTSTYQMFKDCTSLESIDLSGLDTSQVTSMDSMFWNCSSLTSLDLSGFDTSQVTSMDSMFWNCRDLSNLDVSSFNTSQVKGSGMIKMFYGCESLTSLDVSGFDTGKVTSMSEMFSGCSSLTSLDVSGFDTSKVTSPYHMFSGCSSLTSLDVSGFDTSQMTSMEGMFCDCSSLASLDVSGFDTSKVTNKMNIMFGGCSSLASLDVSSFDTSQVTSMQGMFSRCSSLASLDVSGFNTSKVTDMGRMFGGCSGLTSLDVSGFDTSKVTDMRSMFEGYCGVAALDLSGFDTSRVTNMSYMFADCTGPNVIDVSGFNTGNVTSMWGMFSGCSSLLHIDVSSFDTSRVTNMREMFKNCRNLDSLDLSGFNVSRVTEVSEMLYGCDDMETIKTPLNLGRTVVLPGQPSDVWHRPDGTEVTELPQNLDYSIVIKKTYIPGENEGDILCKDITVNQKGYAYANFILKNNKGEVRPNTSMAYKFEGEEYVEIRSDENGRVRIKSPLLENKSGKEEKYILKTTEMLLDIGSGEKEKLDYGVTMEVTVIPLSFIQTWELGVEGTVTGMVGPGVGANVGVAQAGASLARAQISGSAGGTLSVKHSLQNGTRILTLLQSYNAKVAANAEVGPGAEAGAVGVKVDADVVSAGVGIGVGATTGIGLELENYDPTDREQLTRVGKFMLASQAQAGGNLFLLKAAEYLTQDQFYDLEQAGANIFAEAGVDVGSISFGSAAEGSLVSAGGDISIAYNQTKNRKDSSKRLVFGIDSGSHFGVGNLEIGKLEESIFTMSSNGMMELGADIDGDSQIQDFWFNTQAQADVSVPVVGIRRIDAVKVTYGRDAVEQLKKNIGVVEEFAAGSTQYVLGDAQQELFEQLDTTPLKGSCSTSVTDETYVEFAPSLGLQAGLGLEVGIGLEGVSSCWYETEGGTYEGGRKEVTSTNEIDEAVKEHSYSIGQFLAEPLKAVAERLSELWDDVSKRVNEVVSNGLAELKQSASETADEAKSWLLHVVALKDKTRQAGAESYTITAYRADMALAAADTSSGIKEYVVQTVGEPYCVYVTDGAGNEVMDYSVNPLTLTLGYTDELLAAAGLDEAQAGRIVVYQHSNEFCGYVCIGGTVDTAAKKVSVEITKPGQYILAVDGAAPAVKSLTVSLNTNKPLIKAEFLETSGFKDFSMKLDGEEVIGAANWKEHYNKALNSFVYQVEKELAAGTHTCSVYAVDTAGNAMTAPCEIEFEIAMDHGDVPDEDIPEGGVIPEGIWAAGISDAVYTGANIAQDFRLYDGRKLLKEKTDYTVSYKNNKAAYSYAAKDYSDFENKLKETGRSEKTGSFDPKKAPCAVIKMRGNYTGSRSLYFQIEPADIADGEWEADKLTATYTGKKQTPAPKLVWNGKTLKYGTDFYIPEYDQKKTDKNAFKEPAEYNITLKGKKNFTGEIPVILTISKSAKQIAMNKVTVKGIKNMPWTGQQIVQNGISVKHGSKTLSENGDYTVNWGVNKDVGTGTVTFTGTGEDADGDGISFVGVKQVSFKITGTPISKAVVSGVEKTYTYTGSDVKPQAKLTYQVNKSAAAVSLTEGVHYKVSYQKNRAKGTATILFTGLESGGYTGMKKQTFRIQQSALDGLNLAFKDAQGGEGFTAPYMKDGAKPEVIVTFGGQTLVQDKDYKVSYMNNKKTASATDNKPPTVTVKGKGNFKGSKSLTFAIAPKPLSNENGITVVAKDKAESKKANGYRQSFKVYDADGKALGNGDYEKNTAVYTLLSTRNADGTETEVNKVLEKTDIVPADSVIRITVKGKGIYAGGEATGMYRIIKGDYDISKATIKISNQDYTGKSVQIRNQSQFVTDKVYIKVDGTKRTLTLGQDIEVVPGSYVKNVSKGMAKVTFRGINGFGGTKTVSFKIGSRSITEFWSGIFTKAAKMFGI